ncbi:patatin-like phospholipase family protein [Arenibacter sp. GZD96]|uniref:patatin-like phospholipase family protein n=1 Tax=Aurantibrevibacter litoralis TaxID=3106030 RepID=UPI002AFF6BBA|nr:patatin-like phospholipase family protein [Arenibacter sp. GZD-96]MEA1786559.1 patatin-like phospholipase family protein [Arenibacter sp. GZD-96]
MQKFIVFFCVALLPLFGISQDPITQDKDVKVGLVLSGGGAKGLAHIGALKIIESKGIKIDYIGGTSMGAIIGGLYAAGYSANELDSIFRNKNLSELIQDNLPRGAKSFYEKEDSERYALSLPFTNFKVSVPQSFSSGQDIYNELLRLLYHVRDVDDFNYLPIPFLCMATDIETGQAVLLNKGYLPEAILASGTLPSLFGPVEIDDRVLIDGGVVNNYPVEEVRKLGADVIIGVDVQHELRDRTSLNTATEILLQINNFRTAENMKLKSKLTDIYIQPDVENYSVISFNLTNEIILAGEVAAISKFDELDALAIQQKAVFTKTAPIKTQDSLTINQLIIKGNSNYSRGYIKGKIRLNLDKKTTFEKLEQGIGNLSGTGNFQAIRYRLISSEEGVDLVLDLKENPTKTLLRLGAHYDDLYKSAALINFTKKNIFVKDDVGSIDFMIGDNLRYDFQYYVDKGLYWSFGVNSRFNDFEKEVDFELLRSNFGFLGNDNIKNINFSVVDFTNQLYLQTVVKEEFAFILGVEHKFLKYSSRTFSELIDPNDPSLNSEETERTLFEKSNYLSTYGRLVLDTYDDKYFPSKGLLFDGDFHLYLLSSDFNNNFQEFAIAKARMGAAFPLSRNVFLNLETEGGFKLGVSQVASFDFVLGGFGTDLINNFIPFFGYDFLGLPGNSYVKAYSRVDYEFSPKNHLLFSVNFANVADDIFRTGEWFTSPDFSGYGIGYGWESFLGPIQVHYSWSPERSKGELFFSVGYWF